MTTLNTRDPAVAANLSTALPVATVVAAPYGAEGPLIAGTSDTPNSIDTVTNKDFLIKEYNRSFFPGARVRATAIGFSDVWLEGVVTAWDGQVVTIDGDLSAGVGVYSSWNINVAGEPGKQGLTGPQGAKGDAGGPKGDPGPTGPPGSAWRNGTGAPNNSLGVNGDYYLDNATDDVWLRAANFYTIVANIHGSQGAVGPTGPTGPQGIIPEAPTDGGYYARKDGTWVASPGGGNVVGVNNPTAGQLARWTSGTTIEGYSPANFALLFSPVFTGDPQAPTPASSDNDTSIATTAYVKNQSYAPLDSPTFTGTPKVPTAAPSDNGTTAASTAYVKSVLPVATPDTTGDIKFTLKTVADAGWLMFNDGSIGSAASGATFANVAAQALFALLFTNTGDADCPIKTSSGGNRTRAQEGNNATTAWNNNCRMTLPKIFGRALAGAGTGAGLLAHPLGSAYGAESFTISRGYLPQNIAVWNQVVSTAGYGVSGSASNIGLVDATSSAAIDGAPIGNIPPTVFLNVMVKL